MGAQLYKESPVKADLVTYTELILPLPEKQKSHSQKE